MSWIDMLANSEIIFLSFIGVLGLLIGSFLNVVIFRLPKMLQQEWTEQAITYLHENYPNATLTLPPEVKQNKGFNLISPRSQCPYCQHPISVFENIPLLSFIFLKGRCSACKQPISWRYPLVEALTCFLSVFTAFHFGFSLTTMWALLLTWSLIALSFIDIDHHVIPDHISIPMLWIGLTINLWNIFINLPSAVIGTLSGYLFFWIIYSIFKLLTHKEGMGFGDFKLLAMLGAWMGWQALPNIILLSSLGGAMVGIALILLKRHSRQDPIPFGPFLAFAGWMSLIFSDKMNQFYFAFAGFV